MTKFFITPVGVFEEYSDDLFEGFIKVDFPIPFSEASDTIEFVKEGMEEKLAVKFNRMPLRLFQEVLLFLGWCHTEKKSEGFVAHRYIDGVWENVVFPQWNTPSSVCYHPELLLEKSTRVVGDTHSHPPSYGSSHSHTDSLDERKNTGIFIVVKGFTPMSCDPEIIGCVRGRRFPMKADMVFDIKDYKNDATFPEEWKNSVGSTPCKGCSRKTELSTAVKEANKKKDLLDAELDFRLVPKLALEEWRKEIKKGQKTKGDDLKEFYEEYRKRCSKHPRLLRCDNYDCKKLMSSQKCGECDKNIYNAAVIDSIADMLDELQALLENPEEIKVFTEVLKHESEVAPNIPIPNPSEPQIGSAANPLKASVASKDTGARSKSVHRVVVATEKPCSDGCLYKEIPHIHTSKQLIMDAWMRMFQKKSDKCSTSMKVCLYPEKDVCKDGCAWTTSKECGSFGDRISSIPLPECSNDVCKAGGHVLVGCKIGDLLEEESKGCPGQSCLMSSHSWGSCGVNRLRKRFMERGDFEDPSKGDTKRIEAKPVCTDESCAKMEHIFADCGLKMVETQKDDQKGSSPTSDLSIAEMVNGNVPGAESHGSSGAPYIPPTPGYALSHSAHAAEGTQVIVGDTNACPGSVCSLFGKSHRHEISKGLADPKSSYTHLLD